MTQMKILTEMLKKNYVPFAVTVNTLTKTPQILFPNDRNPIFSIVCHKFSDGGKHGLLEVMDYRKQDTEGGLTAQEVFNRIHAERARLLGRVAHN